MTPNPLRELLDAATELARSLEAAEAVQWKPAPIPKPADDTTERASGGHGDPTFQTVSDARRLDVRSAVGRAHYALGLNSRALRRMTEQVDGAVAAYYGSDPVSAPI